MRRRSRRPEPPITLPGGTGCELPELRRIPRSSDKPNQVAVVIERLRAERERTSVIGVAPQRDRPVRARVRGDKQGHCCESRAKTPRHSEAASLPIECWTQEELHNEPVVGSRHLEVHTVGIDLFIDFGFEDIPADTQPLHRHFPLTEEQTRKHKPRGVSY